MLCAQNGHAPCVRVLLDHRAQPNLCKDNGWSPLMAAAQNGHESCTSLLLAAGADASLARLDGATALELAEERGHVVVSKLLREHLGLAVEDDGKYYRGTREGYPDPRPRSGGGRRPPSGVAKGRWRQVGLAAKLR